MDDLFTYETKAGDKIALTPIMDLTARLFEEQAGISNQHKANFFMVKAAVQTAAEYEIVLDLSMKEFQALIKAWNEHAEKDSE